MLALYSTAALSLFFFPYINMTGCVRTPAVGVLLAIGKKGRSGDKLRVAAVAVVVVGHLLFSFLSGE